MSSLKPRLQAAVEPNVCSTGLHPKEFISSMQCMRDHELIGVGGAVLEIRSWSKKTPIVPSLFFAPQTPSHVVTVFTDPKPLYLSVIAMQPYLATKAEAKK